MYYNARYYDPAIGQFISPDTIVPDPSNVLDYNRYMYVRGNPMRYTDPTGHYSDDQIVTSLTEQFGQQEAERIWQIWQNDDSGYARALKQADNGWRIWASDLNEIGYFGMTEDGVIEILDLNNTSNPDALWEWQGQGGYLVKGEDDHVHQPHITTTQTRFSYNENRLYKVIDIRMVVPVKGRRSPIGLAIDHWSDSQMFSWTKAPWNPSPPRGLGTFLGAVGLVSPPVGVYSFMSSFERVYAPQQFSVYPTMYPLEIERRR